MANAQKATTAQSYLLTGAASGNDGKVKVELGDDPDRTGSYQFTFTVYNLSQEPKTYAFGSDVLTEAVETLDGVDYMAETSQGGLCSCLHALRPHRRQPGGPGGRHGVPAPL